MMPERITANREKEFLDALDRLGPTCGNKRLRTELGWDEQFYWRIQEKLITDGLVIAGRGRGGSVQLSNMLNSLSTISNDRDGFADNTILFSTAGTRKLNERELYAPLKKTIENTWVKRFGYVQVAVEETHSRGSKQTGGTFTRPDLTVVGVRAYTFLPKKLEVMTFEIKPADDIGVLGVLEAIAHREAAHRSFVVFPVSRNDFETSSEGDRVAELAQKYGIGILLTEDTKDVETWEIFIDALRHEPDPSRLDRFLTDLPNEKLKNHIH